VRLKKSGAADSTDRQVGIHRSGLVGRMLNQA